VGTPTRDVEVPRFLGFRSQEPGNPFDNRFCAFLNKLECLDIFFLSFFRQVTMGSRVLGNSTRTGFRVPGNGNPHRVPKNEESFSKSLRTAI